MRHGFKKEANEIAREVRKELNLGICDPLNPWKLTNLLEIPVMTLREFEDVSELCVRHFTKVEIGAFSAVTVFYGSKRVIIHNDSHSSSRQASNLAHEAAHGLLHHQPAPAMDASGCRKWDEEIEEEAEYLAGALLVTEEAALWIVRERISLATAAHQLGVSQHMITYRLNITGARKRILRSNRRRTTL